MLSRAAVDAIDAEALAMVERTGQPGLSLALTDRSHTVLHRSIGTADLGTRDPVRPETLFEIGSIGKTFTAVLVMQLADEGRIDVAAPVERYVSWFRVPQPAGSPAITVADLLTHTAGIVAGVDATPRPPSRSGRCATCRRDLRPASDITTPTSATRPSA